MSSKLNTKSLTSGKIKQRVIECSIYSFAESRFSRFQKVVKYQTTASKKWRNKVECNYSFLSNDKIWFFCTDGKGTH